MVSLDTDRCPQHPQQRRIELEHLDQLARKPRNYRNYAIYGSGLFIHVRRLYLRLDIHAA